MWSEEIRIKHVLKILIWLLENLILIVFACFHFHISMYIKYVSHFWKEMRFSSIYSRLSIITGTKKNPATDSEFSCRSVVTWSAYVGTELSNSKSSELVHILCTVGRFVKQLLILNRIMYQLLIIVRIGLNALTSISYNRIIYRLKYYRNRVMGMETYIIHIAVHI